jgi:hypothetical protein
VCAGRDHCRRIVAGRIGRLRRDVIVRGSANAAIPIDGSGVDG